MNKSYKCYFCKFDRGSAMTPNEKCINCEFGSHFELMNRMTPRQKDEWFSSNGIECKEWEEC